MADNYNINEADSGTLTPMAADEISGVKYPRVKAGWGTDGAYGDVSASNPMPVSQYPVTSGGLTRKHLKAAASTNSTSVKGSAGQLYFIHAFNTSASTKFLKLYDKATAPTVGTDTPVEVYPLEAGKMTRIDFGAMGNPFSFGIGLGLTGAVADNDTTVLVANDVILNAHYA